MTIQTNKGEYMSRKNKLTALCCFFILIASHAFAEEPAAPTDQNDQTQMLQSPSPEQMNAMKALEGLNESIKMIKREIESEKKILVGASTDELRIKTENDINVLAARLDQLENNFEGIATGIDVLAFKSPPQTKFDLRQEIQELFTPLILSMKNMTSRPREVEKNRNKLEMIKRKLATAEIAISNLDIRISRTEDGEILKALNALKKRWEDYTQQLTSEKSVVKVQIEEREKDEKSLFQSVQEMTKSFIRTRGKNLFLAFSGLFLVFFMMRLFAARFNRIAKSILKDGMDFYARLASLSYQVLTVISTLSAGIIILYILGDWTLFGLAILFLLSMAWTAKQTLPKHWVEAKMLLNLGTVKEGERVIYNGVPWKVSTLGFYTDLINPELVGGRISLPLSKLANMHSRLCHPDEPWFPCRKNDWVILSDGTTGKIILQSPENVQLYLHGGTIKTYHTPGFLGMNPQNISRGFLLVVPFGLDYSLQAEITGKIPAIMLEEVSKDLDRSDYAKKLNSIKVEFSSAEDSSLNLVIIASFSGEAAESYGGILRQIRKSAVDASTKHGWSIPFPQLTLHRSE